ncbi:hypothetical protein CLV59_106253 [Chitinophaga dinghuensis]|uniref:TspO/MBR related protein n=1 Tax=Chitinophaga dinghuensis TaxID=1539050 RepID=A0A327VUN5_9BACT|nr:hypothetical protein [Chitinophaga dinghuensis]RAJ79192.1 hypothetical protein CLV59_106253 [Chitinophaga dinghuensis]
MQAHDTLYYRNRSIFNSIAFLILIVVHLLSWLLPINGISATAVSDLYPSLFEPAGFTFHIRELLDFSLLAFTICQQMMAFAPEEEARLRYHMQRMQHWFILSCICNAGWFFAWHYELIPLSMLLKVILLFCLIRIHQNFQIYDPQASWKEKWFVHIPFTIYLAWITITTLMNFATLSTYEQWMPSPVAQVGLAVCLVSVSTIISMLMILFRNNILFALVNVWTLYGILYKRQMTGAAEEYAIVHACIMGIGIIAVTISWYLLRKQKSST